MADVNLKKNTLPNSYTGPSTRSIIISDLKRNKIVYLMVLPVLVYYIVFDYIPMYGVSIAFKEFSPVKGILRSPWIGLEYFKEFLGSLYFWRLLKNTILLNVYNILWGFPAPIIFALMLNEIKNTYFKRFTQTVTYMPHFISLIVICGLIADFTKTDGLINQIILIFGGEKSNLLMKPEMFRTIYIASGIWQGLGWNSIIYLSALSAISNELYEAAYIDGAGKWKQMIHVTLPGIAPTIIVLLILRIGSMLNVGFEKIILLYNPMTYETADVISSFVYRKGLLESNYSYATAVGLFNSVINLSLLIATNKLSKKYSETSLW